jgi:hypothetical protein
MKSSEVEDEATKVEIKVEVGTATFIRTVS